MTVYTEAVQVFSANERQWFSSYTLRYVIQQSPLGNGTVRYVLANPGDSKATICMIICK